jgi:hypothetical protein
MRVTRMIRYAGTVLTALGMLAVSTTAAAQEQGRASHARSGAGATDSSAAARRRAANLKGLRGVAAKLNTTPEALETAYEQDRAANPRLSRGNFIAANVLANDLGQKHPNITTPAILSGLERGENVGQTLQSLGLSASEAKQARRAADREAEDGEKRVKDADKRDQGERKDAKQKSRREANDERKRDNR